MPSITLTCDKGRLKLGSTQAYSPKGLFCLLICSFIRPLYYGRHCRVVHGMLARTGDFGWEGSCPSPHLAAANSVVPMRTVSLLARDSICRAGYMLSSVRLSVRHTGGSVKNGWSWEPLKPFLKTVLWAFSCDRIRQKGLKWTKKLSVASSV